MPLRKKKDLVDNTALLDLNWLSVMFYGFRLTVCHCTQRVLSRQEELKERARLLLEQARKDAAMKAGNKNIPNSAVCATDKATNVCDVSQSDLCVHLCV